MIVRNVILLATLSVVSIASFTSALPHKDAPRGGAPPAPLSRRPLSPGPLRALSVDGVQVSDAAMVSTRGGGEGGKGATLSSSTINLVKSCVGAGVLSLPAGVAAFGNSPSSLVPASIVLFFLGVLSSYSFYTIGKICAETESRSLSEAWGKLIGQDSAWLISLSCFVTPAGAAVAYSIMLGDVFSNLAKTVGLTGKLASRQAAILALTASVLYPLCNLKNLGALAPVSVVGVVGVVITTIFMALRMNKLVAVDTIARSLQPSFGVSNKWLSPSILVLVSMGATAYLAHFNAPDFYNELEDNTMQRYKLLCIFGFLGTAIASTLIMSFGFNTFGANCAGVILNNYSVRDSFANLCRLLMGVSVIGSYPFIFAGMKNGLLDLMKKKGEVTEKLNGNIVKIGLAVITALALVLENAGFVVSFNGALMGSAIIYIFPSLMFLKSSQKKVSTRKLGAERLLNRAIVLLGIVLGLVGALVTVLSSFFPHMLA